ncbi:hypothetical protein DFH06DRAFT_1022297 [Mycena polygramma]|nr:hypothetical protein DFH06DRAFT_1022297 [Mycena polygramma]
MGARSSTAPPTRPSNTVLLRKYQAPPAKQEDVLEAWDESLTCAETVLTFNASLFPVASENRWSGDFLNQAVLILEDPAALVRFRYWAAFNDVETIVDILNLAIGRCVPFRLAIPESRVSHFRPAVVSNDERLITPHYYRVGYVEPALKWESGGMDFTGAYMVAMGNVLNRPHAIALIARGGILAWLAQQYRPSLVGRFMRGPSTQVTVHHRGQTDSSDDNPWYIINDEISEQEVRILLGHTRDGSTDYYIFPPDEFLWAMCGHYAGEMGKGVHSVLEFVARAVKTGNPVRRSAAGWKEFLRHWSRGSCQPEHQLPSRQDYESQMERTKEIFADDWSKIKLTNMELPGVFR